jgi:hypothetical protein
MAAIIEELSFALIFFSKIDFKLEKKRIKKATKDLLAFILNKT